MQLDNQYMVLLCRKCCLVHSLQNSNISVTTVSLNNVKQYVQSAENVVSIDSALQCYVVLLCYFIKCVIIDFNFA